MVIKKKIQTLESDLFYMLDFHLCSQLEPNFLSVNTY